MEEELRNQRAMVALLRLVLDDLVAGEKPTLVVQLADNALLYDPAIPAAIEDGRVARGGEPAPERREPVAVVVSFVGTAYATHPDVTGVPGTDEPTQRGLLARADPAFEQDDRPLAMNDLGGLKVREPVLQCRKHGIAIAFERGALFKFR